MNAPLLCIAGGGTGGHVFPALALADAARNRWSILQVQFIGAERGLESSVLPERGEQVLLLPMHSIQGAGFGQRIRVLMWELPLAILKVRRYWRNARPNLVVGVGGYASVTGVLAALLSGIPVILYEQNAIPGMVNRTLARLSRKIMLGFSDTTSRLPARLAIVTGNIVPAALHNIQWEEHDPPRLLVMGGSQGAEFFNNLLPEACSILARRGLSFKVTHAAGRAPGRVEAVQQRYVDAGVEAEVIGFCEDMPGFYASGDLLVSRSGAMSVSEAAMCGMPAVFVPLPSSADNHQLFNARVLADRGAALIAEQSSTSASVMADILMSLLNDKKHLYDMSKAAHSQAPIDAKNRQLSVLEPFLQGVTP